MSYKSPIDVQVLKTTQELIHKLDEAVMAKVTETLKIDIDKDELLKALAYDRGQYKAGFDAGYADGYKAALEWVVFSANERINDRKETK